MKEIKIKRVTALRSWAFLALLLFSGAKVFSQSPSEILEAEKRFGGVWVNKETARHLQLSFEGSQAIILDWNARLQKRESGDVYKARLTNGRLVMAEDKLHHAPYSEILLEKGMLVYLTRPLSDGRRQPWDREVFTRK